MAIGSSLSMYKVIKRLESYKVFSLGLLHSSHCCNPNPYQLGIYPPTQKTANASGKSKKTKTNTQEKCKNDLNKGGVFLHKEGELLTGKQKITAALFLLQINYHTWKQKFPSTVLSLPFRLFKTIQTDTKKSAIFTQPTCAFPSATLL